MSSPITNKRRMLTGAIVSVAKDGIVVVEVERLKKHPLYGKNFKVSKKIKAFCGAINIGLGDKVKIFETRPRSKDVHFLVVGEEG